MLVETVSDARPPPDAVEDFRSQVADALADGWDVRVVAYDDDIPAERAYISAAITATSHPVHVHLSRHAGGDSILVGFDRFDPVPFEDLAVAKGVLDCAKLVARAAAANADDEGILEPVVPFDDALVFLRDWRDQLPEDLRPDNAEFAARLRQISDAVAAGMFYI